MPNHITNIISFSGPQESIEKLKSTIKSTDDEGYSRAIDFNHIVPMPASLNITSGTQVDNGIGVILFRENGDSSRLEKMLDYAWVKAENITTIPQLADYLVKENMVNLDEARIALDNLEKYGHQDWYSWSTENWGTKWNAYSASEDGEGKIQFDTAWSTPFPAINALSKMFSDVEITLLFADEDFGYNCGELVFLDGKIIDDQVPEGGSVEAIILSNTIQGGSLEYLMYHASSEDEEFTDILVNAMVASFSVEEIVAELDCADFEFISESFLHKLKDELISSECYELIGRVDKAIEELNNF